MNDIEILKEMLVCDVQVALQQKGNRLPSVKLEDKQAKGTVEIKGCLMTQLLSERKILKILLLFLRVQRVNAGGLIS